MERNDGLNADEQARAEKTESAPEIASGSSERDRVGRTSAFEELMRRKKKFLIPLVIFYISFYMLWPILAELTPLLDGQAFGSMTWALVYGFAQTVMVLVVAHLFLWQANKWDGLVEKARTEASEREPNA